MPFTRILGLVVPFVRADPVLAAKGIVAIVFRAICPSFNSFSMLKVISPQSFILSPINMHVNTRAIGLIVRPLSVIYIAIHMNELSLPVRSVLSPLP